MSRPRVLITNCDKFGRITNKWYVKIGRKFRVFTQTEWSTEGAAWVSSMMTGTK